MENEEKKVKEKMDAKKVKGVKSKNEKDRPRLYPSNIDEARMLGGVPIKVILPPRREAKESGMSSFEGGILAWRATLTTAGRRMATAPMLFIKADMVPTVNMMTTVRRAGLLPAKRKIARPR